MTTRPTTVRCESERFVIDNAQNTFGRIHLLKNKLQQIQDYILGNVTLTFLHHDRHSRVGRKGAGRTGIQTIANSHPAVQHPEVTVIPTPAHSPVKLGQVELCQSEWALHVCIIHCLICCRYNEDLEDKYLDLSPAA